MLDIGVEIAFEHITGQRPRVVGYAEREAYAAALLLARMEDKSLEPAPVFCGDFRDLDARPLRGYVHILSAGLPCQPYSCAGKQEGLADARSYGEDGNGPLPHALRIIEECGPAVVCLENVAQWVKGGYFRQFGEALADLGYEIEEPLFVRAKDVGASHQRERVFILAHLPSQRGEQQVSEGPWGERQGTAYAQRGGMPVAIPTGQLRHGPRYQPKKWGANPAIYGGPMADHHPGLCRGGPVQPGGHTQGGATSRRNGKDMEHATGHGWGQGRAESAVWSRGNTSAEPGGSVLEHTHSDGQRRQWQCQCSASHLDPEREAMAHATTEHGAQSRQAAFEPRCSCYDLAHASGERRDGGSEQRRGGGETALGTGLRLAAPELCHSCMAHTRRSGLPQPEPAGGPAGGPVTELCPSSLFAPGPGSEQWGDLITHYPHFAPAIEPGLCVLADGVAWLVDASRPDQLRVGGNGVVPLQAAAAFAELFSRPGVGAKLNATNLAAALGPEGGG